MSLIGIIILFSKRRIEFDVFHLTLQQPFRNSMMYYRDSLFTIIKIALVSSCILAWRINQAQNSHFAPCVQCSESVFSREEWRSKISDVYNIFHNNLPIHCMEHMVVG